MARLRPQERDQPIHPTILWRGRPVSARSGTQDSHRTVPAVPGSPRVLGSGTGRQADAAASVELRYHPFPAGVITEPVSETEYCATTVDLVQARRTSC